MFRAEDGLMDEWVFHCSVSSSLFLSALIPLLSCVVPWTYSIPALFHYNEPTPVSYCLSLSISNPRYPKHLFPISTQSHSSFLSGPAHFSLVHILNLYQYFHSFSFFLDVIRFDCRKTLTVAFSLWLEVREGPTFLEQQDFVGRQN